jgi:hypothetical protein
MQGYVYHFSLMSPEDISENLGEFHQHKNLKFENYDESQPRTTSL